MGCGASRDVPALASPTANWANAGSAAMEKKPQVLRQHSGDDDQFHIADKKPEEEQKQNTAQPAAGGGSAAEDGDKPLLPLVQRTDSGHRHRGSHHRPRQSSMSGAAGRHSVDSGRNSTSLPVPPGDSAPSSTPGHTRELSGHHRTPSGRHTRSVSIVGQGGEGLRKGSLIGLLEAGADNKEQMMANQVRRGMMMTGGGGDDSPVGASSSPAMQSRASIVASSPADTKHRKRHSVDVRAALPARDKDASASASALPVAEEEAGEDAAAAPHKGGKDKKKKEKIIKTLELADLQHLSVDNLEHLWRQYDKDKNGTLDRKELKKLAKDCIGRTIAMCEEEIRRQQPRLTEAELKSAVEQELKFVLPGASSASKANSKEDVQKEMVRRLVRKLDVNGDGDVTKAELLATWNVFAKELFQMKVSEGPVNCSIM